METIHAFLLRFCAGKESIRAFFPRICEGKEAIHAIFPRVCEGMEVIRAFFAGVCEGMDASCAFFDGVFAFFFGARDHARSVSGAMCERPMVCDRGMTTAGPPGPPLPGLPHATGVGVAGAYGATAAAYDPALIMRMPRPDRSVRPLISADACSPARCAVMDRMIEQVARFPELDLESMPTGALDERDAALAIAIELAIARRWLTLQTILEAHLAREWASIQPEIRAALLVGAAQMFFLDRVPTHAAVDDAVEWTKRRVRPKAGGLVNAVLRQVSELASDERELYDPDRRDHLPLHDGQAMILHKELFAEEPAHRLAQQTGHADALVAHWTATMGFARTVALCEHDLILPPIVITGLPEATTECSAHDEPGFYVYHGPMASLRSLLAEHPLARVQDAGTAAAVELIAETSPKLIVDYCAGRGTKTRQLAAMFPNAEVVASDPDPARFAALVELASRVPNIRAADAAALEALNGRADLLVLDLPCSNTGVIPRRPEARFSFRRSRLKSLENLQRSIIANALPLRATGGQVLQITCSLERLENEDQASHIARWFPLRIAQQKRSRPTGQPGEPPARYRDGGFAAVLLPI